MLVQNATIVFDIVLVAVPQEEFQFVRVLRESHDVAQAFE
jgi:hypothetical protein